MHVCARRRVPGDGDRRRRRHGPHRCLRALGREDGALLSLGGDDRRQQEGRPWSAPACSPTWSTWPREYGRIRENKYARAPGTFLGLLFLFSAKDATPVAMINDGLLQHYRVGGGAGLGVKYLSRAEAQTVGMIGSGGMARTYLDAFLQSRKIKKVKVFSPNADNAQLYAPRNVGTPRHRGRDRSRARARPCAASTSYRAAPRPTSRCSSTSGSSPACTSPTSPRARSSPACRASSTWPCAPAKRRRGWNSSRPRPTIFARASSATSPAAKRSARPCRS